MVALLLAARDAVRRLKAKAPLAEPVRVVIAHGRYTLAETLTFTADDSGTENCPIVYEAAPGAQPGDLRRPGGDGLEGTWRGNLEGH